MKRVHLLFLYLCPVSVCCLLPARRGSDPSHLLCVYVCGCVGVLATTHHTHTHTPIDRSREVNIVPTTHHSPTSPHRRGKLAVLRCDAVLCFRCVFILFLFSLQFALFYVEFCSYCCVSIATIWFDISFHCVYCFFSLFYFLTYPSGHLIPFHLFYHFRCSPCPRFKL